MKYRLLFITGCYPQDSDYFFKNSKVMPQNAANVLSWRIIEGLDENLGEDFSVVSCPFIGYYPTGFKKLIIHDQKWSHREGCRDTILGFINIKGLETLIKRIRIYRYVKRWYAESARNRIILFYSHYAGFMSAAGLIKRNMPDMHICCLVTDMNEKDPHNNPSDFCGMVRGIPRTLMVNTTYRNLKYVSSFVLLAEAMRYPLGVGTRPYVVVEGISNPCACNESASVPVFEKPTNEFRLVYTGTLHRRYGILLLAQAVEQTADENIKLYVCGAGDAEAELCKMANRSNKVTFLGSIAHNKVLALQKSADLLVNSMPDFGIHTSLSFPSKTMEYMAQGKPVLCFKVPGIPDEYDNFLIYFRAENSEKMAEDIDKVAAMPREELKVIGDKNKEFVSQKKSPAAQVKKIIDLFYEEETK